MKQRRIIDRRSKSKFMVDDEYINRMARFCGWQASIVYFSLCRHVNKDQECFPSITLMAQQHDVSRPTILKGIESLEKHAVISVSKTRSTKSGKWLNNVYTLLDKTEWKYTDPNGDTVNLVDSVKAETESMAGTVPSQRHLPDRVNATDIKDTHGKGNTYEETHPLKNEDVFPGAGKTGKDVCTSKTGETEHSDGQKINEAIELFRSILPGDFIGKRTAFAKSTTREAVEALMRRYSLEGIKALIAKYEAGKTDPYRPQAGTVHEFCTTKLAKIEAFVTKSPKNELWAHRSISTPEQAAVRDAQYAAKIKRDLEEDRKIREEWRAAHPEWKQ